MFAGYLTALQHVVLLTPAQEHALWVRCRVEGDADSRARLIEAYQPLVFKVVMQVRPPDVLLMDMIQEGTVGLIEAVERFDHRRGVRFSTFASYRIRGRILNSLRRDHRVHYSLDHDGQTELPLAARLVDPAADDALASIEDQALVARMWDAVDTLPGRERAILRAMYRDAREPRSVAAELRISLSHFYRLQKHALERVREIVRDEMHQPGGAYG
jgi:RNA polymerase sporulation-specific sigma factor